MRLHKEAKTTIAVVLVFLILLNAVVHYFFPNELLIILTSIVSVFLIVFILQFFRNPTIDKVVGEGLIVAPADGKLVVMEEVQESEYFKDKRIQLSIFMSPINVHVNRNPVSGIIKFFKYHPGKYLVAWHPKASTENERTTVVYKTESGVEVLVRQIAGAVARRIKWYVQEGDSVNQSDDFGFIKFGSRVDVFLPVGTEIKVELNQVIKGGRTVLAELK